MADLELVYRQTLEQCRPTSLVRSAVTPDLPRNVVALGKCAGPLLDGVRHALPVQQAFAAIPRGYPSPTTSAVIVRGGHPAMDDDSFRAGQMLLQFIESCDEVLFLVSGGGSACVEVPLAPWFTPADLMEVNDRLLEGGLPITDMNAVRAHLSAIKGGRLAARVPGRTVTLVYSDVSKGDHASVASGPTVPDPTTTARAIEILQQLGGLERIVSILRQEDFPDTVKKLEHASSSVVADNSTLVKAAAAVAAESGFKVIAADEQLESDVETIAQHLADRAAALGPGQMLIAGGEPTVARRGAGKGGRCSELAVRFALASRGATVPLQALFASSDGVDGNSGAAGVILDIPVAINLSEAASALGRSDSFPLAARLGRAIIIPPTGNNLRDLYLVARP